MEDNTNCCRSFRNYLLSIIALLVTLFVAEVVLKIFLPYRFATIGHIHAFNAKMYGWGFDPHEIIRVVDPDTGEIFARPANNHGWRDKDRTYANPANAYRILIIGDSNTFGVNVPAEKVYTRILEDRLRKNGFNVEVINIAYARWGTDQQLVALRNEGLKYKPNLVIMQFTHNDLDENRYFFRDRKTKGLKPFYFSLDKDNHLIEHKNPYFLKSWTWKDRIKMIISKSQIASRINAIYISYELREDLAPKYENNTGELVELKRTYTVSKNQIMQLKLALNLGDNHGLLKYLEYIYKSNNKIDPKELLKIISISKLYDKKEIIFRILEKRFFHYLWSPDHYNYERYQDVNSTEWRLYFSLIDEANSLIKKSGATLSLFCETEEGEFEWEVYWFRIKDDVTSKSNWLRPRQFVKEYAKNHNIGFIDNIRPYQRARNDPHPTISGYNAMAEDIYDYLMQNHKAELERYRIKSRPDPS
jgi:lysophospholipase L1-like esterase